MGLTTVRRSSFISLSNRLGAKPLIQFTASGLLICSLIKLKSAGRPADDLLLQMPPQCGGQAIRPLQRVTK
jgi:hypothetical protein